MNFTAPRNAAPLTAPLALAVLLAACGPGNEGSGNIVSESRRLTSFSALNIHDETQVEMTIGNASSARVETDDNLQQFVELIYDDDKLEVVMTEDISPTTLKVYLESPLQVSRVDASGSAIANIIGMDTKHLALASSGSAVLELTGQVDSVEIDSSGSAGTHAQDLIAKTVKVTASGSAHLEVTAMQAIDGTLSGSAALDYYGNPAHALVKTSGSSVASKK